MYVGTWDSYAGEAPRPITMAHRAITSIHPARISLEGLTQCTQEAHRLDLDPLLVAYCGHMHSAEATCTAT